MQCQCAMVQFVVHGVVGRCIPVIIECGAGRFVSLADVVLDYRSCCSQSQLVSGFRRPVPILRNGRSRE